MADRIEHRFGFWQSPISAEMVAGGALRFGRLQVSGGMVLWSEGRPSEAGRAAVMLGRTGEEQSEELVPAPCSVRSRVHEYGGGEFLFTGGSLFFVNDADQQVYYRSAGGDISKLTDKRGARFADFAFDERRKRLVAVCEEKRPGKEHPDNFLVAIALDGPDRGQVQTIAEGRDFYASPRLSPDGRQLAYLAWDLPAMPWDAAELHVSEIGEDGRLPQSRRVAGGGGTACFQPEWLADGALLFVWDSDGWGNLFRWDGQAVSQISRIEGELLKPLWSLNLTSYGVLGDGRAVASLLRRGEQEFGLIDLETGDFRPLRHPFTAIHAVAASAEGAACIGLTQERDVAIYWVDGSALRGDKPLASPALIRESNAAKLSESFVPAPELLEIPGREGQTIFASLYRPKNPAAKPRPGELPPLIISLHGGPTSNAPRGMKARTLFFTTRGFAWLDLDYAGSTGYGRAYRDRLNGQYGIRDVADTIDAAEFVRANGIADAEGLFLTGSSSGGYTVLTALTETDIFRGAASYYGICDLRALQLTTHKFESGYLSTLVGAALEEDEELYLERSAISRAERITTPLLLLQGAEDKVVPPDQSERIAESLRERGVRVEYILFAGEGHGFRRGDTIIRAFNAELAFYQSLLAGGNRRAES